MPTDWAQWSRDAVSLMQQRNQDWLAQYNLGGIAYSWDLNAGLLRFSRKHQPVEAAICLIGTVHLPDDEFLWSWADEKVPALAKVGIESVRAFGQEHSLDLLTVESNRGGHAQGLELVAVSGRILDGEGVFLDTAGHLRFYFVLSKFRVLPENS